MDTIDEKRVFDERDGATTVYVASSSGLCRVFVSGHAVGEFGLIERCPAVDVATGPGEVAIGTDEDVLVGEESSTSVPEETEPVPEKSGFGRATAVGYDGGTLVAAGPDGRVARRESGEWVDLAGGSNADVRAIDGDLLATADGVVRLSGDAIQHAGLTSVSDVSAAGVPLAATADGLYRLGNGWMRECEGSFDVVVADPRSRPGSLERAHAAAAGVLYEFADGEWLECSQVDGTIAGIGYGETVYAVTEAGTFLAADGSRWRSRELGVTDVTGLAVSTARKSGGV